MQKFKTTSSTIIVAISEVQYLNRITRYQIHLKHLI